MTDQHREIPFTMDEPKLREPPGCMALRKVCFRDGSLWKSRRFYKYFMLVLTFFCYTCFHLARKPVSMVETVWHQNCTLYGNSTRNGFHAKNDKNWCNWSPFDDDKQYQIYYAGLDNAFEFAYAISMFFSGHIADRMDLRLFLTLGMTLSGVAATCLGLGKIFGIHALAYYIAIQVFAGVVQSSGWPSMVSFVGAWFGSQRKGLIFGIWNAHTSVGNILGNQIAGAFLPRASAASSPDWQHWEWSFIVPGMIIFSVGVLVFLFAIPRPSHVGLPDRDDEDDAEDELPAAVATARRESESADIVHSATSGRKARKSRANFISTYGASSSSTGFNSQNSDEPIFSEEANHTVTFWTALKIPGVVEFSVCLFFAKFVAYTFLYWLPHFLVVNHAEYKATSVGTLASMFDVGGIVGGITAGLLADLSGMPALVSGVFLLASVPALYVLQGILSAPTLVTTTVILILMLNGVCVNGPFALITTCVSAELGMHPCLRGNRGAIATVTAIVDGTGSLGAALGPTMTGVMARACGLSCTFYMLIGAQVVGVLFLVRLIFLEGKSMLAAVRSKSMA